MKMCGRWGSENWSLIDGKGFWGGSKEWEYSGRISFDVEGFRVIYIGF